MPPRTKTNTHFEIAHILFIDVVEFSKMLNNEQSEVLQKLNDIVLRTKEVRAAEAANRLIRLPTGDGMALVFRDFPEAPAKCALEIAAALKTYSEIQVRMGVHSGPINEVTDVNQRPNITGDGTNMAQRVMNCGDSGHILLSKRVAEDLSQYSEWRGRIHDLGEVEVKHGKKISLANLHTEDLGNPALPETIRRAQRDRILSARHRRATLAACLFAALLLSAVLWLSSAGKFGLAPATREPSISPKTIAVLPLQNLSDDKKDAFFAAGLQDDVVTRLTNIKGLKVIGRDWVGHYDPNTPPNLSEIRRALGVAHVLVGSVRRAGDHVLVNVQLIDTANGQHIWAEPYDRTLADSISLQGEVASKIAGKLRVILSPEEKAWVETKPTDNPEAWILYLRGRDAQLHPETSRENYSSSVNFYKDAVALDPDFVLARARLSFMETQLYQFFEPENADLLAEARRNADRALLQDANSAEAHLARARCAQLVGDFALTRSDLSDAVRLRPDDGSISLAVAVTQQQLGWEKEAARNYGRAAELGPREPKIFLNYGFLLYQTGQEAEARWALDHALSLEPQSVLFRLVRAVAEVSWSGQTERARAILAGLPARQDPDGRVTSAYCTLALLERNFPEALRVLQAYRKEKLPTVDSGGLGQQDSKLEAEGTIRLYDPNGDHTRARECLQSVLGKYEDAVKERPRSAVDGAARALLYAWLGWKEPAMAEAARVVKLRASEEGAVKRGVTLGLAKIYAWVGEPDLAWEQIEQFLAFPPSDYTVNNFRLDPVWEPLRNDPRFQKLIEKKKP